VCGTVCCGFWASEFVLCVGQFGVELGSVCVLCVGQVLCGFLGMSFCCVWDSLVWV